MGLFRPFLNKKANKHSFVRGNYLLRSIACLVVFLLHLSFFWGDDSISPWQWAFVVTHTLIYPPIAYLYSNSIKVENRNILADSFLYAVSLAIWGFNPFLMALFISGSNMSNLSAGGKPLFIRGLLFQAAGLISGGLIFGFEYRASLDLLPMILGSTGLVLFTISLGMLIFKINRSLHKHKMSLSKRKDELQHINELASAVNSNLDLDSVMKGVMNALENIYPFESLYVLSYNPDQSKIKIIGAYGNMVTDYESNALKRISMDPIADSDSIFVSGLMKGRMINIANLTPDQVEQGGELDKVLYSIKPSRSIAYFPVYVEGEVVASVAFINYEKNLFLTEDDLQRISEYLVQVGTALKNVRMFDDMQKARKLAEQSEKAKGRFLANMSHEIRTPMTAILGYSEALLDKELDEEQRDNFLYTIIRSGKHLLTVINDILDISKIESSKIEMESIDVELVSILSDLDDYVALNSKEKSLNYQMQIQYPVPSIIQTDPTRLKQILFNLTNNALKFTQKGWVRVEVSYAYEQLIFNIIDTGIGLNKKEQEKIFSAFTQADSSTTRLFGGTGLGLYISKSLAMLMGGDLTIDSEVNKGSCFTLTTHVGDVSKHSFIGSPTKFDSLLREHKAKTNISSIPKFEGRILVAEDNPENQMLIKRLLEQTGLDVTLVENGQLAVEQCEVSPFDLVFLDMQMPIMGGIEASKIIAGLLPHTPLLAFTANVMKHQIDEYLSLGFSQVVEKPILQDHLYSVLRRYLKQSLKAGTVLIVEDNIVNQKVLQRFVHKANENLHVEVANNGAQALDMAQETTFDLILMDMEMPIMGGVEATQELRARQYKGPIHMVSGNVEKSYRDQCLEAGATGYMLKPIDKESLFKLIHDVFSH